MSIDRTRQTQPVISGTAQQNIKKRQTSDKLTEMQGLQKEDPATTVKLSRSTQQLKIDDSQDVNTEHLSEIKSKIDDGTLELDCDKISNALVRDIIDFS
ncbi:flagellar biosynthesis anti-sigma factor FlgM [Enterobacter pasteurii]|uniref:flagellar biosynthesis anti-sigma factor FlgM n=1 Tax=Enterobacter pasteurii TaxID=3029761 RepID=UPI00159DB4F1|nr:flagellar biosynthesis anti-sigma factor FlgM [Enterobacter pasteurii]QLA68118.1 flagellar biosynthesis anti-sigma factor FlgM [Enterobacter pasteurii]